MPLYNDDLSISKDSVFDWGSVRSGSRSREDASTLAREAERNSAKTKSFKEGNGTRYDPRGLSRITDITDLVDDTDDDENDDDDSIVGNIKSSMDVESGGPHQKRGGVSAAMKGQLFSGGDIFEQVWCRQATMIMVMIAIISAASLAIGFAVMNNNDSNHSKGGGSSPGRAAPYSPISQPQTANPDNDIAANTDAEQHLLEVAERVVLACDLMKLSEDISECQKLCGSRLCCFEDDEEYSCKNDDSMDCAVYAGCQALLEGLPMDGAEEESG